MPPTTIVDDRARLVKPFVELVEGAAAQALGAHREFSVAVTGGREAQLFLPPLAHSRVDWRRAQVFFGDERAVGPSQPDSNYGQLKAAWLDQAGLPAGHVHRMPADLPDLENAAREYEATIKACLGSAPALDLFVLGMGADGHVCSLFPGDALVEERERLVAAVHGAPKPPPERLTMTLPMIERARLVTVLATTEDKRRALDEALHNPHSRLPIALVLRAATRVVVFTTYGPAVR